MVTFTDPPFFSEASAFPVSLSLTVARFPAGTVNFPVPTVEPPLTRARSEPVHDATPSATQRSLSDTWPLDVARTLEFAIVVDALRVWTGVVGPAGPCG